jgi:TonB family protein
MSKYKPNFKLLSICFVISALLHSVPLLWMQQPVPLNEDSQSMVKSGFVQVEFANAKSSEALGHSEPASATATTNTANETGAQPASLVGKMDPIYPKRARERGEEGDVTLDFSVDETGRTSDIKVVKSSESKLLDDAAIQAVATSQFSPAKKNDVAISTRTRLRVSFRIKDE